MRETEEEKEQQFTPYSFVQSTVKIPVLWRVRTGNLIQLQPKYLVRFLVSGRQ